MPEYRIALQYGVSQNAPKREQRAYREPYVPGSQSHKNTRRIYANSPVAALLKLDIELTREGEKPRVISVEEVLHFDDSELTDEMITDLLISSGHPFDNDTPDEYDGYTPTDDSNIHRVIADVCEALSNTLLPGLTSSCLQNSEGWVDYMMIEYYDASINTYKSVGIEPGDVIEDETLIGWPAVISIARGVIGMVKGYELT